LAIEVINEGEEDKTGAIKGPETPLLEAEAGPGGEASPVAEGAIIDEAKPETETKSEEVI
jgi:hypothetical protein